MEIVQIPVRFNTKGAGVAHLKNEAVPKVTIDRESGNALPAMKAREPPQSVLSALIVALIVTELLEVRVAILNAVLVAAYIAVSMVWIVTSLQENAQLALTAGMPDASYLNMLSTNRYARTC